jgi:hypothetical protein
MQTIASVERLHPHRLVEELTDALEDTVRIATAPATELEWQVHLDYLRAMQRVARETLAGAGAR